MGLDSAFAGCATQYTSSTITRASADGIVAVITLVSGVYPKHLKLG